MTKITMNDVSEDHHLYTQMVDPNNISLSILTNSNDTSHEHTSTMNINEVNTSSNMNATSLSNVGRNEASNMTNGNSIVDTKRTTNDASDKNDDTESVASRVSFGSSTDGIDILRGNISTPTNFVEWSHLIAARIVSSVLYKRAMLFCILLSSLLLAIRTMDQVRESSQMIRIIEVVLHFLLILFTIEMLLAIVCFRELVASTGWLCSDIVIICIVWYTDDSTFLILRAFRLIRALRKASSVPSLQWAVRSILHVLPRLTAVVLVLIPAMIAIFAILFTNLYQDADMIISDTYTDGQQQYGTVSNALFHRLDVSALTLFQIMTGGRNWAEISTTLMSDDTYPMAWLPLIGYVIISMFVAAALVIALMCDAVTAVKHNQMLKVFEQPNVHHVTTNLNRLKNNNLIVSLSPGLMDTDFSPTHHTDHPQQMYHRLEQKILELNNNIDILLRMQVGLQESIDRLSVPHQNNIGINTHGSSSIQAPLSPRQLQYQQQQLQPQISIRNVNTASTTSYSTALLVPGLTSVPSDEH